MNMPESVRTELAALAGKSEDNIDFSDIPATTEQDWRDAVRFKFHQPLRNIRARPPLTPPVPEGGPDGPSGFVRFATAIERCRFELARSDF